MMSSPVWQAKKQKRSSICAAQSMSCAVTFLYLYTAEFLFRCKSGKSNCTFVGQEWGFRPTMQQSIFMFIIEQP